VQIIPTNKYRTLCKYVFLCHVVFEIITKFPSANTRNEPIVLRHGVKSAEWEVAGWQWTHESLWEVGLVVTYLRNLLSQLLTTLLASKPESCNTHLRTWDFSEDTNRTASGSVHKHKERKLKHGNTTETKWNESSLSIQLLFLCIKWLLNSHVFYSQSK
jgi:hypothetical protein